ncbi:DNA repair protein RecO [Burkholderiales bacterium]|nr:MAG: DNA repair protein RecO [Burkholderiales bacterium]CAG1010592.1 DNA repair protein RecO [Burkholderiales bacterium]
MSTTFARCDQEQALVLHSIPYRETSLVVEIFSAAHGRLALVARGARRPRSALRGLMQAFQPLVLSWSGKGELRTLHKAEWLGGLPALPGPALLCGFYLNELLLKLLPREDPHPALYQNYLLVLGQLASGEGPEANLRAFELRLLAELGYAPRLDKEAGSGQPIDPLARYHYVFDRGPQREAEDVYPQVHGATLLALTRGDWREARCAREAKQLMREILQHHLEQRGLFSRQLLVDLQDLEEREGST